MTHKHAQTDSPEPQDKKPHFRGQRLATLRLAGACALCVFGLLTIIEAPWDPLWKPTIAITEVGHMMAIVPATFLLGSRTLRRSRWAFGAALLATGLFLSPLARSALSADAVASTLEAVFPQPDRASRRTLSRSAPLIAGDLWRLSAPTAPFDTILFSPDKNLSLDLYPANTPEPAPLIVFIHGGGWANGDSTQLPDIFHHLVNRGLAVASVNYRKAPAHPFPAARDDVIEAIAHLKKNAQKHGLDPTRIILAGRSAGAHLALVVGYSAGDPAIKGVVDIYGPSDPTWSWDNPSNPLLYDSRKTLSDFLDGSPSDSPDNYRDASPILLAHTNAPPTLILHGGRDGLVSAEQSDRLSDRLTQLGVKHALVRLPWGTHGFDANLYGPSGQPYLFALERFLDAVLQP